MAKIEDEFERLECFGGPFDGAKMTFPRGDNLAGDFSDGQYWRVPYTFVWPNRYPGDPLARLIEPLLLWWVRHRPSSPKGDA